MSDGLELEAEVTFRFWKDGRVSFRVHLSREQDWSGIYPDVEQASEAAFARLERCRRGLD